MTNEERSAEIKRSTGMDITIMQQTEVQWTPGDFVRPAKRYPDMAPRPKVPQK